MSTFAYSVAIKLSVANLASQGIRILGADLMAAHGKAVALGDKLKALKLIAVGYGMDKAGQGILGFMGKAIDASQEYTRQLSLMNQQGLSHAEVARATAAAWATSRDVITTTAADNLKAIRELKSVFGPLHMGEAYAILPAVQRTRSVLEAITGKEQENVAFDMVKAIELRTPGLMTVQRMQQNADLMARTLMAFNGTLNVNDFHMGLKQAKTSAFGLNDDFVYNYFPTLMQEVKGKFGGAQSAGTALMTTYAAVIGGTMKKSALPLWEQMGLISPSDVVKNSTGALQLKPGAVKGAALFQANPFAWANQVLAPAINAYGTAHGLNREQVISGMFGNRNAQWLMNTFIGKAQQFERDKGNVGRGGNSYETYQNLLKTNPQLAEQAMHAQWQNILMILGYQVLPKLIPWMIRFANGLDRIGQFMSKHSTLTMVLAFGLLGVGTALSLIGKVLMTVGVIRFLGMGPVVSGLFTTIGTAIAAIGWPITLTVAALAALGLGIYELWKHWDTIGPKLKAAWNWVAQGVGGFINTIIGYANKLPFVHIQPIDLGDGKPKGGSPYVPKPHTMTQRAGDVYLDGKKVGKVMTPHLLSAAARDASRPGTGRTGFDPSRAPMRPATNP